MRLTTKTRDGSTFTLSLTLGVLLLLLLASSPLWACSINAAGTCGGDPCPTGETCKKVSDFECKCVKNSAVFRPCPSGEKACEIATDEWVCWAEDDPCPEAVATLAGEEQTRAACLVVFSEPGFAPTAEPARGTQQVSVSVSGCNGCYKSQLIKLPGNVIDVAPLTSKFSGAMNSTGMYWLGDTVWESSCFGNTTGSCGSVQRTYLVAYE